MVKLTDTTNLYSITDFSWTAIVFLSFVMTGSRSYYNALDFTCVIPVSIGMVSFRIPVFEIPLWKIGYTSYKISGSAEAV